MSSDISRQRFNPANDFRSVLMQQGRVQLDADWNEWNEILDRRWRAETIDIIGRGTVPKETLHGFEIGIDANNNLTIGCGRIYVDGLLAENHGEPPPVFDPVLAEARGSDPDKEPNAQPVLYHKQPYFPKVDANTDLPPELQAPTGGGPHLVYVDVWEREVTYVEDPNLVENAVGVDTTSRLQTAWQVRILKNGDQNATCDTSIQAWDNCIAPSAGRLTTRAIGGATSDDPCLIPPSGGYRGLENRTYRVEIHKSGAAWNGIRDSNGEPAGNAADAATFKWSRDNASVAANITRIEGRNVLTVDRTAWDSARRFSPGDWVEITDDWRELSRKPGDIRRIATVDGASRTITLNAVLTPNAFPVDGDGSDLTLPERHTRIKRWDQAGSVKDSAGNNYVDLDAPDGSGVIPVPLAGTSLILEDGVQITFTTERAGGTFRSGDYWIFVARTADASVEELTDAPPRGIHHHYCRLAMWSVGSAPSDCRKLWPPEFGGESCDCTVCVTPESHSSATLTIQDAINQVIQREGGTVCLDVGTYHLQAPIQISGANSVRVRGHGAETKLLYAGADADAAIVINNLSNNVIIEDLSLHREPPPYVRNTPSLAVQGLAILAQDSSGVILQRNVILVAEALGANSPAIGLGGTLASVLIRENVVTAPIGVTKWVNQPQPPAPQMIAVNTLDLIVLDNYFQCSNSGILFDDQSIHAHRTLLAENFIAGCWGAAINMCGFVGPNAGLDVWQNEIYTHALGIKIGASNTRVESNHIASEPREEMDGIVLTSGFRETGLSNCQILSNRILGEVHYGIRISGTTVVSAMIKNNFIQNAADGYGMTGGIVMGDDSSADQVAIENNQILDLSRTPSTSDAWLVGIRLFHAKRAQVVGNMIVGLGAAANRSPTIAGIQLVNVDSGRVDSNELVNIGAKKTSSSTQKAIGIWCVGTFGRVDVTNNTVRRNEDPQSPDVAKWTALMVFTLPEQSEANEAFSVLPVSKDLSLHGFLDSIQWTYNQEHVTLSRGKELVGVHGNVLNAYGAGQAVLVYTTGPLSFANNRCVLDTSGTSNMVVYVQRAGSAMITGNYVKGPEKLLVLMQLPQHAPVIVLGNITSGPIKLGSTNLPPPWAQFNVNAV